ncbi:hypothetical protein [Luminiphilus sp. nBUS_07]|uniref:hypothetical protein n=1 Tax=Luminiphilus sp. nBUS_07 TaxID=3395314 RepID=UPI003EC0AADB
MTENELITIVTVVKDDEDGLIKTLASVYSQETKPGQYVVVTPDVVRVQELCKGLQVDVVVDPGHGVYSAMNVGRQHVRTPIVLYLNAGDEIEGDPLKVVDDVGILKYRVVGALASRYSSPGFHFTVFGRGYCHQAVLLPRDHQPYNEKYRVSADFGVIRASFPNIRGASKYPVGSVVFYKGGLSTVRHKERDREIAHQLWKSAPVVSIVFWMFCNLKWLIKRLLGVKA